MTAWELASQEVPYKDVADASIIKDEVKAGKRADILPEWPRSFSELIQACWAPNALDRLSMDKVITALEQMLKDEGASPASARFFPSYQDVGASLGAITEQAVRPPAARLDKLSLEEKDTTYVEYERGLKSYEANQYGEALACFLKIAYNERHAYYPTACLKLWRIYKEGLGISIDQETAVFYAKKVSNHVGWFLQEAERARPSAQTDLGLLYCEGCGLPQDYVKAREWFEKAAMQGDVYAQTSLGFLYHQGLGVCQDYAKARECYGKVATQGYALAQNNLGVLYRDGLGVRQDYAKAHEWFEKAAAQGHARAQTNLGFLYENGHGVRQDYAQAREWYKKAAAQGDAGAQTYLGVLCHDGLGVHQDYAKAREWYEQAAAQGNAWAQANLGILYEKGLGVRQDYAKAREWYEKAAAQGDVDAQAALAKLPQASRGLKR
jgi:hypothetical protein